MPNSPNKYRAEGDLSDPSSDPVSPAPKKEFPVKSEIKADEISECPDPKDKLGKHDSTEQSSFSQDSEKTKDLKPDSTAASISEISSEVEDWQQIKDPKTLKVYKGVCERLSKIDNSLNKLWNLRVRFMNAAAMANADENPEPATDPAESELMDSSEFCSDVDDDESSEYSSDTDESSSGLSCPTDISEDETPKDLSTVFKTMREVVRKFPVEEQEKLRESLDKFRKSEEKRCQDPTAKNLPKLKTVIDLFEYALQ